MENFAMKGLSKILRGLRRIVVNPLILFREPVELRSCLDILKRDFLSFCLNASSALLRFIQERWKKVA